eukprot:5598206-Amphidinium_carterae.2
MGSQASLASTADINNPFSTDYVERVGPPQEYPCAVPLGATVLNTVRTLHTEEFMDDVEDQEDQDDGYDDQQADFGEDDLEMVPTPPRTQEELEEPRDLEAPSPCLVDGDGDVPFEDGDVPFEDEDVPPPPPDSEEVLAPPTFDEIPVEQLTHCVNSPDIDEIPLDELPMQVSTVILPQVPQVPVKAAPGSAKAA